MARLVSLKQLASAAEDISREVDDVAPITGTPRGWFSGCWVQRICFRKVRIFKTRLGRFSTYWVSRR